MPTLEIAQTSVKLSSTQQKLHVWHLKCIKLIKINQVLLAFLTTTFDQTLTVSGDQKSASKLIFATSFKRFKHDGFGYNLTSWDASKRAMCSRNPCVRNVWRPSSPPSQPSPASPASPTSTSTGARPSTRSRTRPGTSTPRPSTRSRTRPD